MKAPVKAGRESQTPSDDGSGTYSWTTVSAPGPVSFSSQYTQDPTFTASVPGDYVLQVSYAHNGPAYTATSGTITVFDIEITGPNSPTYAAAGVPLQLDSTPSDDGSGTYSWTKESGPGDVTFSSTSVQDPNFTATVPGDYVVRVTYSHGQAQYGGRGPALKIKIRLSREGVRVVECWHGQTAADRIRRRRVPCGGSRQRASGDLPRRRRPRVLRPCARRECQTV
jgi:hypothetical protein